MASTPTPPVKGGAASSFTHVGEVICCNYAATPGLVVSGGWDGNLSLWDAKTGTVTSQWRAGEKPVSACAFTPDGTRLVTGTMEGLLGQWDLPSHRRLTLFLAHTRPISAIAFSPDGKTVATSSWDHFVKLWSEGELQEVAKFKDHHDIVAGCQFCPDRKSLLSWAYDGTLNLWEVASGYQLATWPAHASRVTAAAVAPNGHWFASGSRDGTVTLWSAETCECVARYAGTPSEIRGCFFSADAELLVTVSVQGEIVIHAVPHFGNQAGRQTGFKVQCAALAPAGNQLALGTQEGKLQFLPLEITSERGICVTATESQEKRPVASIVGRLFGRQQNQRVFRCTCPICHKTFELNNDYEGTAICPKCTKKLRVNSFTFEV